MARSHRWSPEQTGRRKVIISVAIFLLLAVAGLAYIKWWPYYNKAWNAAIHHTIGNSILSGQDSAIPEPSWHAAWEYAAVYYKAVWKAALLGILLGSLLQVLLPSAWLLKALGGTTFGSTAVGGVASLPGMMCSCCAAPMTVGMRKKQASVGASLAFWLGNPTLNPATLVFMTFVLSWKFTLIRLVFGLLLTFGVSYFANRFAGDARLPHELATASEEAGAEHPEPWLKRWLASISSMLLHLIPAYALAVLLLGAARAWLFPVIDAAGSNSLWTVIGFAIAGTLFVIPTAAEIPIIQSLMSAGLGGGPAAALLLTLPAVSLPSMLMVARSFPVKVIVFVAGAVIVLGILSGLTGAWLL
ncbi:hypothetical protein SAMN02799630_03723 [Paenibacillus sp. UNCCL117]|uniref:permease n=1 Tax=unclassified Paenibacillus TaxID=185978 RepID=UPI0008879EB8|nr:MULTISPECIES: permease [unclassified Paenibacillus]SDD49859.1 hypothetical protein SAMN04488602_10974 [Paenibacillus sp. cl123]SFW49859.1 hypothetical protein SAMN02799630_03723 [Paenibacillus sp. UNCCL117]